MDVKEKIIELLENCDNYQKRKYRAMIVICNNGFSLFINFSDGYERLRFNMGYSKYGVDINTRKRKKGIGYYITVRDKEIVSEEDKCLYIYKFKSYKECSDFFDKYFKNFECERYVKWTNDKMWNDKVIKIVENAI